MSSLIPGNNKHLSLKDREYIEQALNNRKSFREIARYLCKDPSTISKEVWKRRIVNRGTEEVSTILTTSVSTGITVKKRTHVASWSSAIPSAVPAINATVYAPALNGNPAGRSKKHHMSAMDVRKNVIAVRSIPNMITMQKQHKGSMRNCFQIPGQV